MSEQLTGFCPNCGNKLVYAKNDATVTCYACDSVITAEELSGKTASGAANEGISAAASMSLMMMGFDNPESGVVFIENFFDNYDWEAYAEDTDIAIPDIAEVVKNNKMKNGACATSWYLDYKALAYPVRKKIEGLALLQDKMAALYNPVDSTNAYQIFDTFRRVSTILKNTESDIFKQLETAIKYAEKFELDAALLSEMKADIEELKSMFENDVYIAKDINEVAAYVDASKVASREKALELSDKGINAEEVYANALARYNDGSPNKNAALMLFEQVRGYEESAEYIKKINQYFSFNGEVYRAFGKHFIYKQEDYTPTLDIKQLKAQGCSGFLKKAPAAPAEDAPQAVKALSLYEIIDGMPAKDATIKGITQIITCYGSRLYYIKSNAGIYCFDIYSRTETCICKGLDVDFMADKCKIMSNGSSFYIVKVYKEEAKALEIAKGCSLMQSFGKKSAPSTKASTEDHVLNPYCVVVVDMKSNTCETIIREMAEFERNYGDKIFYYYSYKPEVVQSGCMSKFKKVEEPEAKKKLMVCDLITRTSKEISEDCQLHTVSGDYILYSMWRPNQYNKDLHAFNLETNGDTVIEKNIYNYFNVFDDKVYYTVGNSEYSPLVRNNLEGTERIEVMPNVENIICERGGWLYVQKGRGFNSLLAKVSSDGTKVVVICTQVKQYVRFDGNYMYYVDIYNNLRVVRIDGKCNRKLAENVNKIFPCDDGLYYTRQETVAKKESALSLYLMDKNGRNIKKVVFNVDCVQNDQTTNTLYLSKAENVRFKVYAPKQEDKATYEFHKITKYSILDKATGECELFLTLGWPSSETQTGCLKKKSVAMVYVEAPIRPTYEREDITDTTNPEDAALDTPTPTQPGCGAPAGKSSNAGCASLLKAVGGTSNLPNKGGKQSAQTKLSSVKTAKAAKSTTTSKSARKVDFKTVAVSYIGLVMLALGVFMFTNRNTNMNETPFGWGNLILCTVAGIICIVLALNLLGILPFPLKKSKRGKPTAAIYILAAVLWLLTGFWGIGSAFGSHSSGAGSNESYSYLYLNSESYVYLENGEKENYKIDVKESGNYILEISDCSYDLEVYTSDYGWKTIYYGTTETSLYLYSGTNSISFRLTSSYSSDGIYVKISKEPSATSVSLDSEQWVSLSDGQVQKFKVNVPNSGKYLVKLTNCYSEVVFYSSSDGTSYLNSDNAYQVVVYLYSGDNEFDLSYYSSYTSGSFYVEITDAYTTLDLDSSSYIYLSENQDQMFKIDVPETGDYLVTLSGSSFAVEYYSSYDGTSYLNSGNDYQAVVDMSSGTNEFTLSAYYSSDYGSFYVTITKAPTPVSLNSSTYVSLSEGETEKFSIDVTNSGKYLVKLTSCYYEVKFYSSYDGTSYLNSSNNYQAVVDMSSGTNEFTLNYYSSYNSGSFYLYIEPASTEIELDSSEYVSLSSGETEKFSIDVARSGEYLITLTNCYYEVKFYSSYDGTSYLNSSNNYQVVVDMASGTNEFTLNYYSSYNSGSFYLTVSHYEPFADDVTKIAGSSTFSDSGRSMYVGAYDVEWFEFVAPQAGYYTFSLDSYSYAYMVAYSDSTDSGSNYTYTFDKYMSKGESLFIKVKGYYDYTNYTTFYVSGSCVNTSNAPEMYTGSSYSAYVTEGGYVWFTFYGYSSYYYYVSVSTTSGYYNTTYIYDSYGSLKNSNSGYSSSSTSSYTSGGYYYVRIYSGSSQSVTVSISRSSY